MNASQCKSMPPILKLSLSLSYYCTRNPGIEHNSMDILLKPNGTILAREVTPVCEESNTTLRLRRRCTFSFVLIENRPYLNHCVFGEPRDGMNGLDRGLTTRAHRSVVCAAAPLCGRRRAWREESRRVFAVSNRLYRPKSPLVCFI